MYNVQSTMFGLNGIGIQRFKKMRDTIFLNDVYIYTVSCTRDGVISIDGFSCSALDQSPYFNPKELSDACKNSLCAANGLARNNGNMEVCARCPDVKGMSMNPLQVGMFLGLIQQFPQLHRMPLALALV